MLSDNDIHRIVERIVAGIDPIAVGSFGSYAVGHAHEGSDLDLFIIQNTILPSSARRRHVARYLYGVLHPLDVHVFTPDEFEAGVREELSFAWVIVRQACIYHASATLSDQVPSLANAKKC